MRWLYWIFAAPQRRDRPHSPESSESDRGRLIAAAAAHDAVGCYAHSLALLGLPLTATPNDAELQFARASTLYDWGRYREALDGYLRAAALGLERKELPLQIGWSWFRLGNPEQAEIWMRRAVIADPDAMRTHFGLATVLQARNQLDEAIVGYERCLELDPDHFQSLVALSGCTLGRGDPAAAEELARRAIAADCEGVLGWMQLAVALDCQSRYDEAIGALARAESLEAASGEDRYSFVSLAIEQRNAGGVRQALEVLEPELASRPSPQGYCVYGATLLSSGRMREGWNYYEFRWLIEPGLSWRRPMRRPAWAGQSLRGKTILLRVEQGYGDGIQLLRYAPCVKALGATVLLQAYPGQISLAAGFPGVDRVFEISETLPDFNFHLHLLSLPRVFGTELPTIPANVPYLRADAERVARWAHRLPNDGVPKVGIVWAGSPTHLLDRERSVSLAKLTPVLAVEGVRFYALQKGPAAAETAGAILSGAAIVDLGAELDDFADTAAVISQLDLLLCVDTAVAHLAGALGTPVWLMLPHPAEFRWMEKGDDSPWYPTMRLFRQPRRGDWDDVVLQVKGALERWVRGDCAESPKHGSQSGLAPSALVPVAREWPPPGHRPGFSAVTEARVGILQYLPDEPDLGAAVHWYGEFLQPQLELLARCIRPGSTAMEVGAGVGVHALALAGAVGLDGHLFLYEPRPIVRRILHQNLTANRVFNVTVMRRALGRSSESARSATGEASPAPTKTVPDPLTETLDDLQMERLDWLKINDSTTAMAVFDGATATLWRLRPRLFLTAESSTLRAVADRAREFGYRCWRVETPLFNPENFNCRDDDIFSGRSALALLAIPEEAAVDVAFNGCAEL